MRGNLFRRIARALLALVLAALVSPALVLPPPASAASEVAWEALRRGGIALTRHALAPGTGDPAGMRIGDCTTQRNLNAEGRAQARAVGEAFRQRGIAVGGVLASQWCRATETAELAFPGQPRAEPAFNSFFDTRQNEPAQTAAARRLMAAWQGPGALFVSTHQVNITALTGIVPASGEMIVLERAGGSLRVVGRLRVP